MPQNAAKAKRELLRSDGGDGDEDEGALMRESARVASAVRAPLDGVLSLRECQRCGPLQSFEPELRLIFSPLPTLKHGLSTAQLAKDHGLAPARVAAALQALAVVLVHLLRLRDAEPGLRSAFWLQLLASSAVRTPSNQTERFLKWMIKETDFFPRRIMLVFSNPSEKQLRAVAEYFTRQREEPRGWRETVSSVIRPTVELKAPTQEEQVAFSRCDVGLSFDASMLSEPCLRRIQQLLDQVSVLEPRTRLCEIRLLTLGTLGHLSMKPAELKVVAEILSKSNVYQLRDVNLQGIVNQFTRDHHRASLLSIVRALFRGGDATERGLLAIETVRMELPHYSLSLARIQLDAVHIAAICSLLRYGCAFAELSLASVFQRIDSSEESAECWRWLAFGLFYPRSKQFAASFRLRSIDLSGSHLSNEWIIAFSRTLVDPVAEFRRSAGQATVRNEIIICELMLGAKLYSLPDTTSKPLLILDREQSWEVLFSQGDTEWLNVVIPGHGLGWVGAHHVLERNQELLVGNKRVELVLNGCQTPRDPHSLDTFMASVGHRLRSLEFSSPLGIGVFAIFKSCRSLEHLSLANNSLASIHAPELIQFLRSSAVRQLTSLNLNNTRLCEQDIQELAEALKNPRYIPRLQELRLKDNWITEPGIAILKEALLVNKSLVFLELHASFSIDSQAQFNANLHNESVYVPSLPLPHKLAIISAITSAKCHGRAGKITERWIFERIFDFTGLQVERKILWSS